MFNALLVPVLAMALSAAAVAGVPAPQRRTAEEYQLKAVYILKFIEFINWPADRPSAPAPFTLCIVGNDPFGASLDRLAAASNYEGDRIVISRLDAADSTRDCEVIFMAGAESFPEALANQPILTIGEGLSFAEKGGVIGFILEKGSLRFAINAEAAAAARLRVSSHLLRLGTIVEEKKDHP